jgi:hypothetical protein
MPQLADNEILTMEVVGENLGFYADKDIFGFFFTAILFLTLLAELPLPDTRPICG